jgi:twitching motility two-component system response regulator PilH
MSQVLLVEDNPIHQTVISAILKANGLSVVIASDGVEALEQVQLARPNLIILDILMPRMDGYELCRRLKGDAKTQKIAVIIFSTKSEECDFFRGCKQGADAYLSKLGNLQELVNTVKRLLHRTYA